MVTMLILVKLEINRIQISDHIYLIIYLIKSWKYTPALNGTILSQDHVFRKYNKIEI